MTDLNKVKAGKYELVALRWDQITSKPGAPLDFVRHRRGDKVDLNVEDARRLVRAGAVKVSGDEEPTGTSVAPGTDPDAATATGDTGGGTGTVPATGDGSSGGDGTTPAKSASKADWVAYATDDARGEDKLDAEVADKATKDQLVDMFGQG